MGSTDIEKQSFSLQILEAVEENDADDITMTAMNETEYITYNVSAFNDIINKHEDHNKDVHPSKLIEVV